MATENGARTRETILAEAARLASVEGLEGISLGQLAKATGMSKSGLYAHFDSKRALQLAATGTAREVFIAEVIRPGLAADPGRDRVISTCEAFLSHVERGVFPGGCFFAAAASEVAARPGPVHDAVASQQREWLTVLERLIRAAQDQGEIDAGEDPAQLAFELDALLVAANTAFILHGDPAALDRGRTAVARRLGS